MRKPNYDKFPSTKVEGKLWRGWESICGQLASEAASVIAVDFYPGVHEQEIFDALNTIPGYTVVNVASLMKSEEEVRRMTDYFMTDDVLFGHVAPFSLGDFFDMEKVAAFKAENRGNVILAGTGAAIAAPEDAVLVYADMARWEIQMRFRRHEVHGIGVDNSADPVSIQYKRGYFIDWRVADRYKDGLFTKVAYWLDTNAAQDPKMIESSTFMAGIEKTARKPFRVVPFFDPAPWGGQWMKDVCDLDRSKENYGWCFDCVPEENSLLFNIDGVLFEIPSVDLVLLRSRELLGEPVEGRFGKDFPIRFDFLDTIGGGNLSLQVHPTTQFVHDNFGIAYTQDESYYLLDADEDAVVYIGLKEGVDKEQMIEDLRAAQRGEIVFDAEKYVNKMPAKKHDHFLIPGGTIHCSGAGGMVLEISSTPNIFTFKLWDWQRLGLDGKPRPINVERGSKVIDWGRDTAYVNKHLRNHVVPTAQGEGWKEESTGLHPNEPIEVRRTYFNCATPHNTGRSVNVFNLAEGEQVTVSSPTGAFEPFEVHYAETFIVPACVEDYIITPSGPSEGKDCITLKAYVRF
ncbi:MAG: class I mannose-6-phosphate isomerase [Bacteroidales bacterium]|nr:class I mannose-6-phosphate isomerase [Bacteroidales bacterium]